MMGGNSCGVKPGGVSFARRKKRICYHRGCPHPAHQMEAPMTYTDILYEKKHGVAWITINRPEVRNAFRTRTVAELTDAFVDARWDPSVGVAVLTGAGDRAFCSGGDQKERGQDRKSTRLNSSHLG